MTSCKICGTRTGMHGFSFDVPEELPPTVVQPPVVVEPKGRDPRKCRCGDWAYGSDGFCGPNYCYNTPA